MKFVEEVSDVAGLGAEAGASALNDGGIQSETLRDVDAGRGSGDADFQFVGRLQGGLVEADGGVEHAGRVRGVDLERCVVRGDDGQAADVAEVSGDGDGQGGALFGIGGGAEFVEQDQRMGGRGARNEINVGDVRGEGGEILFDRLVVADIGKDGVEDGDFGAVGGDGQAGLRHEGEQSDGFQRYGFAAGVGAGDDELAARTFEFDRDWDYVDAFCFQIAFQQRMPGIVQKQASFARLGQPGAAVPTRILGRLNFTATQL